MPRANRGPSLKWVAKRKAYYIVWYEAGAERVRSTGTTDRIQAEEALADFLRERRRIERPDRPRDPDKVLIADVLDFYGEEHAPETKDPARIGYAIAALLPYWGERPVSDITKSTCRAYAKERGRAPATIRRELTTLRAALNLYVEEKRLTSAPHVQLPEKPDGKERWLTRSEASALLNAARTGRADVRLYLPLFILIGLYTGARKEAILSLRWPQIDLVRGRINFAREGETQTGKRRARQPIPRGLLTFLRLARRRGSDLGHVIHDKGRPILDIGDSNNGSFGGAVKRAGLAKVSPHTLRHTCGTWMAQKGVPLHQIGGWLGHSDARTTQLYAHHHPEYMEEARRAHER
ncbi:tyrosine-type recombinase/integrase [Sphingomonas sp.]|uniref:tyrosine-type recombinase/integrase n=1 Tax=Sphingomonas sp. TaxID=28214 RepID=UPI0035C8420F